MATGFNLLKLYDSWEKFFPSLSGHRLAKFPRLSPVGFAHFCATINLEGYGDGLSTLLHRGESHRKLAGIAWVICPKKITKKACGESERSLARFNKTWEPVK